MWKKYIFNKNLLSFSPDGGIELNEFDKLLQAEWDRAESQGLFTFNISNNLEQRILENDHLKYIIELNPTRYEKRRKPYRFTEVSTEFDRNAFHFNKINDGEILLSFGDNDEANRNLIIINNSPIRRYHFLLVPDREKERNQVLTVESVVFALRVVASSAHPFLMAGFNSLCAYASINHLHFHGLYLPQTIYAQTADCSLFHEKSQCYLLDLLKTQAFAFEVKDADQFETVAQRVHAITQCLTQKNIAHNVAVVKGYSFSSKNVSVLRVFIWFRQSVTDGKMFSRCNFAVLELAGFMILPLEKTFHDLTVGQLIEDLDIISLSLEEIRRDINSALEKISG